MQAPTIPKDIMYLPLKQTFGRFDGSDSPISLYFVIELVVLFVQCCQPYNGLFRQRESYPIYLDTEKRTLSLDSEVAKELDGGVLKHPTRFLPLKNFFKPCESFEKMFKDFFKGRYEPDRFNDEEEIVY